MKINAAPLSYHSINFNLAVLGPRQTPDILFGEDVLPPDQVLRGKNVDLCQVIERMQVESKRQDEIVSSVENALLIELFWRLIRAIPRDRLSPLFLRRSDVQAFGERLRRIFDRDIKMNLSTTAIATDMGVSVRTLTKRCREVMGLSLMRVCRSQNSVCRLADRSVRSSYKRDRLPPRVFKPISFFTRFSPALWCAADDLSRNAEIEVSPFAFPCDGSLRFAFLCASRPSPASSFIHFTRRMLQRMRLCGKQRKPRTFLRPRQYRRDQSSGHLRLRFSHTQL